MKKSILLAAALFACPAAEARMPAPAPQYAPVDCTISVAFGSFGAGIDGPTLARMVRRLHADRRVGSFTRHPWGREGEVTLCVHLVRLLDVYRVGRSLNALVPARPRGPIEVHYPRRMPAPD